jgi:TonB family protein
MRIENIAKLILPSLVFGACATGKASAVGGSLRPASPGDPGAMTAAGQILAAIEDPRLPHADQASAEILDEAGDEASATVELCVAPDGHVERVDLKRHSTSSAYDRAVVRDVADWQFGGDSWAPPSKDTCEIATINYVPPL